MKKSYLLVLSFLFLSYSAAFSQWSNVTPADGQTGVSLLPQISWSWSGGSAEGYAFISKNPAVDPLDAGTKKIHMTANPYHITKADLDGVTLDQGTKYYWYVEAFTYPGGVETSFARFPLLGTANLSFTTAAFSNVKPINGQTGVPLLPEISWTLTGGAAGAVAFISKDPAFPIGGYKSFPMNASPYTIKESDLEGFLEPATKYYWTLTSTLTDGIVIKYPAGTDVQYFTTYPDVSATLAWPEEGFIQDPSFVVFSWYTSTGTAGLKFKLQLCELNGAVVPTADKWAGALTTTYDALTTTSKTVTGLKHGVKYFWRVLTTDNSGNIVSYSSVQSFTTSGGRSIVLTGSWPSEGKTIYSVKPMFTWYCDQYPAGVKYQLRILESDGSTVKALIPWDANISSDGISGIYYTLKDGEKLEEGKNYSWQVRSYDPSAPSGNEWSSWSAAIGFEIYANTVAYLQPVASYPADEVIVYTKAPVLYWYYGASAAGITFDVQMGLDKEFNSQFMGHTAAGALSYAVLGDLPGGLLPGTTYYWRVKPSMGTEWSVAAKFTVAGGTTSAAVASWPVDNPTEYTAKPVLYWYLEGSGLGITGYKVKYSTNDQNNWVNFNPTSNNASGGVIDIASPLTTSYTFTSELTYGQKYYWAVATNQGAGTMVAYSALGSFTIVGGASSATPILSSPENTSVVYSTKATLYWYVNAPSNGITVYNIKYIDSEDPAVLESQSAVTSDKQSKELTGLIPGHTYYWKVQSCYTSAQSNWSEIWHFTVAPGSTVQPLIGGPNKIEIATNSPVLSWVTPVKAPVTQKYELTVADNPEFSSAVVYSGIEKPYIQLSDLNSSASYYWKVRANDEKGNVTDYSGVGSFTIAKTTAVKDEQKIPENFSLAQNYPNPFNPATSIAYTLPENSFVTLKIYDLLGREIRTLVSSEMKAGSHSVIWNGQDDNGRQVVSGIYLYKLNAGSFVKTLKMVLLK